MAMGSALGAMTDLGLGNMLSDQQKDQTDEELRKKRLGLSSLDMNPLAAMTGIATNDLLGMSGASRR